MSERVRVAVIGAGPAGCTLAGLLAARGVPAVVFDDDQRPDLLVGESLLPAVILALRRLGIEQRVADFSSWKPGVTFLHRRGLRLDFRFPEQARDGWPNYAYNVPRPQFDRLLRQRAEELGVQFVDRRAEVVRAAGDPRRELWLSAECVAAAPALAGRQPDLLVDGSGRARVAARVLDLGARRGRRNDVALFAHFENFRSGVETRGQVVITTLAAGWSWRIPLEGRLSVGVVMDGAAIRRLGKTPEERLENAIRSEPLLADDGRDARRVSAVMRYSNYQLISERGHGPGWVAIGDAFGFVDPMLSPGLFMAMEGARLVDHHVFGAGVGALDDPARMADGLRWCDAEIRSWHHCWEELIEYVYDGRLFSLCESGAGLAERSGAAALPRLFERHLTRHIAAMASGLRTRSGYSRRLLRFATKRLVWGVTRPEEYAIGQGADARRA